MKKLEKVFMANNHFEQFDKSICNWTGLVELYLASNKIKALHLQQNMQNLVNLKKLYL